MTSDVVIVGAGSAGCLLAERLTRDPRRTVLLIERGPGDLAQTRLDTLPIAASPRTVPVPELGGRPVVRGAGVGGSSAINGAYFLRGHRADYASWPWPLDEVSAAFDEVETMMRVSPFADTELGDVAAAFESAAVSAGAAASDAGDPRWPTVGVNRVRSNRTGSAGTAIRWTSAHALAAAGERPGLRLSAGRVVRSLTVRGDRVTGVVVDGPGGTERIDAGEVILCAGAFGTAELLVPVLGVLPVHEHAEMLVRFTPRRRLRASALLQTVLHTDGGLEIRPYGDDFHTFAPSIPASGVPIGVADMAGTVGTLSMRDGRPVVDLGEPGAATTARMGRGIDAVIALLESPAFGDLVTPGSITVDPVVGMSQHAWGSLPAGSATDAAGAVRGLRGLRVVDGSILPGPLRSGPHASIAAVAALVGARL